MDGTDRFQHVNTPENILHAHIALRLQVNSVKQVPDMTGRTAYMQATLGHIALLNKASAPFWTCC
jgi:hypothetical protein